ncbi:MAG: hypothetical protein MI749_05180, partial [Desulfovibrionales bacterium]|nr:hypothetical protein [Desulfovibrionales bacterium]
MDLSKKQFENLKELVYASSGIHLHEGKKELLKSKIAKRMRVTRKDFSSYLQFLSSNQTELVEFIDTVTTNHSFFFRENKSIEYIVNHLSQRREPGNKKFKIWCAACSTGDEAYSVAVQLKALDINFSILATDISHSVLSTAIRGIYRNDKVKNVPDPILHRYFQKGFGRYEGFVRVKKDIRSQVHFQKFNLIRDPVPTTPFDAVLCRNVMIYFAPESRKRLLDGLLNKMRPGG